MKSVRILAHVRSRHSDKELLKRSGGDTKLSEALGHRRVSNSHIRSKVISVGRNTLRNDLRNTELLHQGLRLKNISRRDISDFDGSDVDHRVHEVVQIVTRKDLVTTESPSLTINLGVGNDLGDGLTDITSENRLHESITAKDVIEKLLGVLGKIVEILVVEVESESGADNRSLGEISLNSLLRFILDTLEFRRGRRVSTSGRDVNKAINTAFLGNLSKTQSSLQVGIMNAVVSSRDLRADKIDDDIRSLNSFTNRILIEHGIVDGSNLTHSTSKLDITNVITIITERNDHSVVESTEIRACHHTNSTVSAEDSDGLTILSTGICNSGGNAASITRSVKL